MLYVIKGTSNPEKATVWDSEKKAIRIVNSKKCAVEGSVDGSCSFSKLDIAICELLEPEYNFRIDINLCVNACESYMLASKYVFYHLVNTRFERRVTLPFVLFNVGYPYTIEDGWLILRNKSWYELRYRIKDYEKFCRCVNKKLFMVKGGLQ